MFFCVHSHASCTCVLFHVFLNGAYVRAPCVVVEHADFIVDCIVLVVFGDCFIWNNNLINPLNLALNHIKPISKFYLE
jgi:hypothetical protein